MKKKTTYLVWLAALVAVLTAPTANAGRPQLESPTVSTAPFGSVSSRTTLLASAPRHLSAASWWGGTYAVPDGEHVTVYILSLIHI